MEFHRILDGTTDPDSLQRRLTVPALPTACELIDNLVEDRGADQGVIYCLWGEFRVNRELIHGGVRFSLPDCPNGVAWTLTTGHPPDESAVVLHLTMHRREHEPDFIESLEAFADAWQLP